MNGCGGRGEGAGAPLLFAYASDEFKGALRELGRQLRNDPRYRAIPLWSRLELHDVVVRLLSFCPGESGEHLVECLGE